MSFGPVPVSQALGAVLAHSVDAGGKRLKKGTVLGDSEIRLLEQAGISSVIAARPRPDDVGEDEAARLIAAGLGMAGVDVKAAATGRVNIHASHDGVFTVARGLVDGLNAIDPAITLATLAPFTAVRRGQMVATVKIIPFHAGRLLVDAALAIAGTGEAFAVHRFMARRAALIQTELPGLKASVLNKTAALTAARLSRSGSQLVTERRTAHDAQAVADAIRDLASGHGLVIVFGASAMCDPADVIPEAIRLAGGHVERAGMPVDPGNLLVLGSLGEVPVIGAPGCARSPKENGFDWVLDRLLAGLPVTAQTIAGLGVGGLLMEIATRPQPRETGVINPDTVLRVDALVLAAGKSSRMGGPNKLLAQFSGEPLIRKVVKAATDSEAASVTVVSGHQAEAVGRALEGCGAAVVHNQDFAEGLATSLRTGLAALPNGADGALVILGDMPGVTAGLMDRLIATFRGQGGQAVVRAMHGGKRGNPVILPASIFDQARLLTGDTGARHLVEMSGLPVIDIEAGDAALLDVDTPEALAAAGGRLPPEGD
ncbi:MAG: molybdopterin-binding/glycosyltransferase family 2 protein [Notoacmeibacter sp.]|nr:molybdopterin-binding/glycosyltransferase family 2 protein [Notoacmeibacter sp.]MCC0032735.1 NTP transferase domain-containing protein [Brucellaceae bacterium]